jgi:hypothetical protein
MQGGGDQQHAINPISDCSLTEWLTRRRRGKRNVCICIWRNLFGDVEVK